MKINSMDMYSLWWVEQTLNERKTHFDFKNTAFCHTLVFSKNYVRRSVVKQAAGMKTVVTPNRSKTPQK